MGVHCELNIGFCYSALSHYYRSKIMHWTVCNIKETEQITWSRVRLAVQKHWMNQQYWIWCLPCLLYLSVVSTRRCKWITKFVILYIQESQSVDATRLFHSLNRNKNMPSSSASIKRVSELWFVIHTQLRNRLENDKASNFTVCYRMLRGQSEID